MNSDAVLWTYALAPDVEVEPGHGGAFLRTATSRTWVEDAGEIEVLGLLAGVGSSEADIHDRLRPSASDGDSETRCAALLFRLDRVGLLARGLSSGGRRLVSWSRCARHPRASRSAHPRGRSGFRRGRSHVPRGIAVSLEAPGSWASMTIHDRDLLPLLHDLAVGRSGGRNRRGRESVIPRRPFWRSLR